jgi:hypothetical protein
MEITCTTPERNLYDTREERKVYRPQPDILAGIQGQFAQKLQNVTTATQDAYGEESVLEAMSGAQRSASGLWRILSRRD